MTLKRINIESLKKTGSAVLIATVFIMVLALVLFQLNKDKIARSILQSVNEIQQGELIFDDLSFNPLVHFPYISLGLNDITYFEEKDTVGRDERTPILSLENLYIAFNIIDLIQGKFSASTIFLEDGQLNLVKNSKGILNIMEATKKNPPKGKAAQKQISSEQDLNKTDSVNQIKKQQSVAAKKPKKKNGKVAFELDLNAIILNDIAVNYVDEQKLLSSNVNLKSIIASLQFKEDTIICSIKTKLFIDTLSLTKGFRVIGKELELETNLSLNKEYSKIKIEPSSLAIGKAKFLGQGEISLKDEGYIDMDIMADDEDFGILNLFLTNNGIENIEKGELFFNVSIKGSLFSKFPRVKGEFGIKDFKMSVPTTTHKVSDLALNGSFDTGTKEDFEEAVFTVSDISGKLPKGGISGQMVFANLLEPRSYRLKRKIGYRWLGAAYRARKHS